MGAPTETTEVGFMTVDTAHAIKSLDPIAWNLACDEYVAEPESDEEIVALDHGNTYYWTRDLQELWE